MRWFDAAAVRERTPMPALVRALARAFAEGAEVPQRHAHALPGGASVLLMPAWREGGRFGVKTVTICPGNGALGLPGVHGLYSLFDAATGVPLAVLDGSELTARRTAAASALAASFLARADATRLVVVGAGRVAALIPEAMRAVRPGLSQVTVWARRGEQAAALAARWRASSGPGGALEGAAGEQGVTFEATTDLGAVVRGADIVSCATLAAAPLVQGAWLAAGSHLDLIGSFTPAMREADGAALASARVYIDTTEALAKSGDLLQAIAEGAFAAERVAGTLADLVRGACAPRSSPVERTVFKSVGNAIEDLAAAELVFDGPG
jgi:ornithine cyclodeaminase